MVSMVMTLEASRGTAGGGALEGAAKGALEGAADAAGPHLEGLPGAEGGALLHSEGTLEPGEAPQLEGGAGEVHSHDAEVPTHSEAQGEGGAPLAHPLGTLGWTLSALRLRSAPLTLVVSLVVALSWLFSVLVMEVVPPLAPGYGGWLSGTAVLLLAPLFSLPLVSLAIRPLARVFTTRQWYYPPGAGWKNLPYPYREGDPVVRRGRLEPWWRGAGGEGPRQ